MRVLGLTGSIAMGKSTAASMLRRMGVPVHDADRAVHRAFAPGGSALTAVAAAFPEVISEAGVDRARLGARVFALPADLARLETIVHPIVAEARRRFLATQALARRRVVALDVPLLLETGGDARVDAVVLVTAPAFLQAQRALARPGMTTAKLAGIRTRQMPDRLKRRRSQHIVETGLGLAYTWRKLARALRRARRRRRLPDSLWVTHARDRPRYRNDRPQP